VKTVYLGLGSNVGKREQYLQEAVDALASPEFTIRRISSVYETEPRDYTAQSWFLNAVIEGETGLLPIQLLHRCRQIERDLGRKRSAISKGPRVIDIDILLHGRAVVDVPQLVIPHASMHERRFVLEPLAELAPELKHPVLLRSMRELLAATSGQKVRKTAIQLATPKNHNQGRPSADN
jgi:2-amino-4-hydroxy-6-hydroxymethyldihydropteridine diphosphokinase